MNSEYSPHDILAFLQGKGSEEACSAFQKALQKDELLRLETKAYQVLIDHYRRRRFMRFLEEVTEYNERLSWD